MFQMKVNFLKKIFVADRQVKLWLTRINWLNFRETETRNQESRVQGSRKYPMMNATESLIDQGGRSGYSLKLLFGCQSNQIKSNLVYVENFI